jgi:hypothetical protein
MDNIERIKANAALVLETFGKNNNVELDYDESSVEWLDGYIERNRHNWDAETAERLSSVLGSFLGECLRRNFGGDWQMTENGLGIAFAGGNVAFPFNKIRKHIQNGSEDSIISFYRTIPVIFS